MHFLLLSVKLLSFWNFWSRLTPDGDARWSQEHREELSAERRELNQLVTTRAPESCAARANLPVGFTQGFGLLIQRER